MFRYSWLFIKRQAHVCSHAAADLQYSLQAGVWNEAGFCDSLKIESPVFLGGGQKPDEKNSPAPSHKRSLADARPAGATTHDVICTRSPSLASRGQTVGVVVRGGTREDEEGGRRLRMRSSGPHPGRGKLAPCAVGQRIAPEAPLKAICPTALFNHPITMVSDV